ncbi:MAG: helix-turn-helix transcriptional regulator [Dysgonamonadaceae bacterium]|jgi:transcriptional regulator with XRE-family HTH domain|nr:helix-turn-helix transcriptional regulator [Dysgonamonadaceae bacterium]
MNKILSNVRIIRERKNLSQEQIADLMGLTQSAYARFERGATKTDLETLQKFCDVVGYSLVEVITYPKRYVDFDAVQKENSTSKIIISFEVDESYKDSLVEMIISNKRHSTRDSISK